MNHLPRLGASIVSLVAFGALIVLGAPVASAQQPHSVAASFGSSVDSCDHCEDDGCDSENNCCGPPKTLFSWGYGQPNEGGPPPLDEPLVTDRPDFTEASVTVGRGVAQVEAGYTYFSDDDGGATFRAHTFPETLLRVGVLAEWLELRFVWTYVVEETTTGGATFRDDGGDNLQLGMKIALTPQKGILPEMALIPQMFVPTGSDIFTGGQIFPTFNDDVLPGLNWIYAWEITDRLSLAGSTQGNRVVDETGHGFTLFAQSIAGGLSLTEQLGAYLEWFAFFPHSAVDPAEHEQQFLNGGFTYLVSNNFQLDIRSGLGLNREAENFFTGAGLSIRR